jgi:hypothetical protein
VARPKGFQAAGKLRFLVLKPEIEKALAEERSLKGFYELNKDRLKLSYSQLCRYVRAFGVREAIGQQQGRFIRGGALEKAASPNSPHAEALRTANRLEGARPPMQTVPSKPDAPRDFHYDPMDAYRIKFD